MQFVVGSLDDPGLRLGQDQSPTERQRALDSGKGLVVPDTGEVRLAVEARRFETGRDLRTKGRGRRGHILQRAGSALDSAGPWPNLQLLRQGRTSREPGACGHQQSSERTRRHEPDPPQARLA